MREPDFTTDCMSAFMTAIGGLAAMSPDYNTFASGVRAALILIGTVQELNPSQELARELVRRLVCEMKKTEFSDEAFTQCVRKWNEHFYARHSRRAGGTSRKQPTS